MKILIHAVPQRMWYVQNFMIPQLREQGYEGEKIFLDDQNLGNLEACLRSFEQLPDEGGTWHLQDDLLLAKDFVKRAGAWKGHVANGFCCIPFFDSPWTPGEVYMPDLWHSFQCIYIPNRLAKEFVPWVRSGQWIESPCNELPVLKRARKGDDTFFREFLLCRHPGETAYNFKPNLVEHIDWLIGGSTLKTSGKWFPDLPRSALWEDEDMVSDLHVRLKAWKREHGTIAAEEFTGRHALQIDADVPPAPDPKPF